MYISSYNLRLFDVLASRVPERTPKRVQLISEIYKEFSLPSEIKDQVSIDSGDQFVLDEFCVDTTNHYKFLLKYVSENRIPPSDSLDCLPIVYLPEKSECCGSSLSLSREGISGKGFSSNGTMSTKVFQSQCKVCKTTYFPGFSEFVIDGKLFRSYSKLEKGGTYMLTTKSVFSLEFLRNVTDQIVTSSVQFDHLSQVYNRRRAKEDSLDGTILLESWIGYHIVKRLRGVNLEIVRKTETNRKLCVELITRDIFPALERLINGTWIVHRCQETGCRQAAAIIDANEKNHRMKCAYQGSCTSENKAAPNYYSGCINNPKRSTRGTVEKSRFCENHLEKEATPTERTTREQVDLRPVTRSWAKKSQDSGVMDSAEEGITSPEGCRGEDKITRFFDRTGGIIYIVRPCLIRLGRWEMYGAESLSQWAICFVDCFGENPPPEVLSYILGDRVCGFQPYLKNLAKRGNKVMEFYSKLKFILDTFHADKHVQPVCLNDPTVGKFNPRLPMWAHMQGTNYEGAEQTFRFINRMKSTTNFMTFSKRLCFFLILDDEYNQMLEENMEKPDSCMNYKIGRHSFTSNPLIVKASEGQEWREL